MSPGDEKPLSPLDAEIETLLSRLAALQARSAEPEEESIRDVALKAIRDRLRELSRKCTDTTCRIRTIDQIRRALDDA
jgi:hypothetical protein